ncbi:MAG: UDP-N-acetylglucosamine 2-epimerase (hydrolyzing) [Rhodospirillaceae bacterium]|nr:UDP-N-acetylglucosamine 2-epimerase (hydrolyzing) [Rhodospirillaceae bacterium]
MRKIAVFTGSRADYGIMRWVIQRIQESDGLTLSLIVSGSHLSAAHGSTWRAIAEDGLVIDHKIHIDLDDDSRLGIACTLAAAIKGISEVLERDQPDILVVLGDRYEMFAAAQSAMILGIPIAHIHGGESTEGAIDEAIRHAVTKMAHLHFTAAEPYRQRGIQLGEAPARVFNVGAPGLDNLRRLSLMARKDLEDLIGIDLGPPLFLITYHPETVSDDDPAKGIAELLCALDAFPEATMLFTKANADMHGAAVNERIEGYVAERGDRTALFPSLGQRPYLSALAMADAVIGNSSSGIIEAPSLGTPTVNIGTRQDGRLRAASVIDCDTNEAAIARAIRDALDNRAGRTVVSGTNPYDQGEASGRIVEILRSVDLNGLMNKRFHDIPVGATQP